MYLLLLRSFDLHHGESENEMQLKKTNHSSAKHSYIHKNSDIKYIHGFRLVIKPTSGCV
jgi:hypothetical protein